MIELLPSSWGRPPRPDPALHPREVSSDTSFAGLLGARDRDVARKMPRPRPTGQVDPNVPSQPLAVATSGLIGLDPAVAEGAVAEQFNEHGFFGSAVPAVEDASDTVRPANGPSVGSGMTAAAEIRAETVASNPTSPVPASSPKFIPADGIDASAPRPKRLDGSTVASRQLTDNRRASTGSVDERAGEVDGPRAGASLGRRMLAASYARATQSATWVAISESERGLQVAAFAATLSAEEQSRLRDEIAALLSRHGLVSGRIHVTARRVPRASA